MRASHGRFGDEIKIGAYRPLTAIQPPATADEILLAVESSMHVVWSGGPEPWVDSPESHFHRLRVQGELSHRQEPYSWNHGPTRQCSETKHFFTQVLIFNNLRLPVPAT